MTDEGKGDGEETTSLTKVLLGVDGKPLEMQLDGGETEEMTVRRAVLLSLLQGPEFLVRMNRTPLGDGEKLDCFVLARDVSDKERTGYTFASEEVTLIKKLAAVRLPTEPYGALVLELDPGARKKT